LLQLRREDNGHDDTVDGDDFAENDGDEVLGSDTRGFDAASEDGCAGDKDSPIVGSCISLSSSVPEKIEDVFH
jgi:hypothetical protein